MKFHQTDHFEQTLLTFILLFNYILTIDIETKVFMSDFTFRAIDEKLIVTRVLRFESV